MKPGERIGLFEIVEPQIRKTKRGICLIARFPSGRVGTYAPEVGSNRIGPRKSGFQLRRSEPPSHRAAVGIASVQPAPHTGGSVADAPSLAADTVRAQGCTPPISKHMDNYAWQC